MTTTDAEKLKLVRDFVRAQEKAVLLSHFADTVPDDLKHVRQEAEKGSHAGLEQCEHLGKQLLECLFGREPTKYEVDFANDLTA